ncbi:MAG: FAD-binding protein [Spirochaetaceae bacterium]|jgi:glycolate oxidase|nr:FAD-binding protein [Spirochaetaceae bacterium]
MRYKDLTKIIPDTERLIPGDRIEGKYLSDALGRSRGVASALLFPLTSEEVRLIAAYANERAIPITARSGGTNLTGSTVPHGGLVIDFSRMNRILEIDRETLTATVEPGVVLADFQGLLEAQGLFYPPDPGEKTSTIGGNIATNAGGMRAVKYGVTRDYVRALEIVTADGKILWLGGKTVKDASGLSLKNLIIGSEGTLALITKIVLKLIPLPAKTIAAVAAFPNLDRAAAGVNRIIMSASGPTSVEFLEREVVKLGERFSGLSFPLDKHEAFIIASFDGGDDDEILQRVSLIEQAVRSAGAEDFAVLEDTQAQADMWRIRGCLVKAVEAVSEQEPMDIVVPINKISDFIAYTHELEAESGIRMVSFGHAGDGNIHLCIIRGDREQNLWEEALDRVMTKLYRKTADLGGLVSGEHGIGIAKRSYYLANAAPESIALMRAVKSAFDPNNILNPGKSYS